MLKQLAKKVGPTVPIIYVDSNINQNKTNYLLRKLRRQKFYFAQGLAVVCSIENCMPVQVDKIYQQIARIKQQHKIPVYTFLLDECNSQSYYMSSLGDEVYALQSTIFKLKRDESKLDLSQCLQKLNVRKYTIKSSNNITGVNIDKYTSANTSHIGNTKQSHIDETVYNQSINQRIKIISKGNAQNSSRSNIQNIPRKIPDYIIGTQAMKMGLIDNIGEHYDILRQKYPDSNFDIIKYHQQPRSVKKALVVVTSPILLGLFIFKVFAKWSLIMYVWFNSTKQQKKEDSKKK